MSLEEIQIIFLKNIKLIITNGMKALRIVKTVTNEILSLPMLKEIRGGFLFLLPWVWVSLSECREENCLSSKPGE